MTEPRDKRQHLTELCVAELLHVASDLEPGQVRAGDSLLNELMLDSFTLAAFAERLDQTFPAVDLTKWLMRATQGGADTIEALVSFLLEAEGGEA